MENTITQYAIAIIILAIPLSAIFYFIYKWLKKSSPTYIVGWAFVLGVNYGRTNQTTFETYQRRYRSK